MIEMILAKAMRVVRFFTEPAPALIIEKGGGYRPVAEAPVEPPAGTRADA